MKVKVTRLDTNSSEILDVTINKKNRPVYTYMNEEHILVDRTYPATYTYINSEKPMSDKFQYTVELVEGDEKEIHDIWNKDRM